MQSHKLAIKLFAESSAGIPAGAFVPVFHGWIQRHALPDHLLIDVADYQHVPDGPGTLLITHEANLGADHGEGRLGLLYFRKQPITGAETFPERLRAVLRYTLQAAQLLEQEPSLAGKLKFRTDEISFRIHDRLLAPNTAETFNAVRPQLHRVFSELFGGEGITLEHQGNPEKLCEVTVRGPASDIASLLDRLPAPATTRDDLNHAL